MHAFLGVGKPEKIRKCDYRPRRAFWTTGKREHLLAKRSSELCVDFSIDRHAV